MTDFDFFELHVLVSANDEEKCQHAKETDETYL